MLSKSIADIREALEDIRQAGDTLTPALQWQLISSMRKWEAAALTLEAGQTLPRQIHGVPFQPVIVAGTEASTGLVDA